MVRRPTDREQGGRPGRIGAGPGYDTSRDTNTSAGPSPRRPGRPARARRGMTKADSSMKVSLVVASGVHQGKAIPIAVPQFLIGRDPQCHLRPASQAVSKQHCAVVVRDGQVYLKDFGSTNG